MLLAAALALLWSQANAAETAAYANKRGSATLVSDVDSIVPGKPFHLGLRIKLSPGWHTYWSNPGDAGAPPELDVTWAKAGTKAGPTAGATVGAEGGATVGPIQFPVPEKLHDGPFTSFAYTGEVLLPVTATADGPASITAQANWLVCATVCVPETATFHLDLPAGNGAASAEAGLFAAAAARMPRSSPFAAHVTREGVLWLAAPGLQLTSAVFFPAEAGVIDQGAAEGLRVSADRVEVALKPVKPLSGALSGVLVLKDLGGQVQALSVEATPLALPADAGGAGAAGAAVGPGLLRALILAFAGGLILNLMPCVLPVLAIKALSLAKLSGSSRTKVRRDAAAYTLGVVVAFCAIGGITLALRAAGDAVGWGVQFQSAAFTTATGWLLFAMGLNLSGVFMLGGQLAGAGQGFAARGSFATGLLAVVVATPCTAPFMGAALAAALTMNAAAGMLIFVALGLGLAAPYAALALSPRVVRLLPRPGAWMELFKQILAFPMYAAALWMVWVASQQTDPAGLAAVFASFLLVGFAAWAFGLAQTREPARVLKASALAGLACGVALLVAIGSATPAAGRAGSGASADGSEPYSAARLARLRAEHRPVLVDMSAAWCITCLVNERLALQPAEVRAAFAARHVAYLKGDWTRRDAAITAFLRDHDRDGVPLYVYFPAEGAPEVLPQTLTPGVVLTAIEKG
jgi:thiol:disulfide interchange protein DsbD